MGKKKWQACGALALSLAIAGSLPAVRCRSDEAAWANLHSILLHKATRLGEYRCVFVVVNGRGHGARKLLLVTLVL